MFQNALWYPLSYFVKRVIERRTSRHNPLLEVVQVNGRTLLNARSVNYSFGSLHSIFDEAFNRTNIEELGIDRVLLLGLGGGSVISLLRQRGISPSSITAVEIDPVVIELARRHFALDSFAGLRVECADALAFVQQCRETFDLVIVDVFIDDEVPRSLEDKEFLTALAQMLAPRGRLLYNRLVDHERSLVATNRFARVFSEVFEEPLVLAIRCNAIFVASGSTAVRQERLETDEVCGRDVGAPQV